MLDAVAGARPTVIARRPPAVLDHLRPEGVLPVLPQEVGMQSGRDMAPRQDLLAGRSRWTYQSTDRPWRAMASVHRSRSKCSLHSWNVPPARHTSSITAPIRRSPRLAIPSARVARASCQRSWTPFSRRSCPWSRPILSRSSPTVSCRAHWNGVWALGTKPPTLAVAEAPPYVANGQSPRSGRRRWPIPSRRGRSRWGGRSGSRA